jgi:hypothetical protein
VGTDRQPRLDEAKIETLRIWGEGLSGDPRDEVRAAGRAITMLVEEIERLNVDLWNERAHIRFAEPPVTVELEQDREPTLQRALMPRFGSSSA